MKIEHAQFPSDNIKRSRVSLETLYILFTRLGWPVPFPSPSYNRSPQTNIGLCQQPSNSRIWFRIRQIGTCERARYGKYLRGRSYDPGNRAGPLSGINFSCVHMVVFIPPTGMKFDIDWYVYLKVWKINYVIPSTHAHFNIFHPGRRIMWKFQPACRDFDSVCRRSRLAGQRNGIFNREITMSRDLA